MKQGRKPGQSNRPWVCLYSTLQSPCAVVHAQYSSVWLGDEPADAMRDLKSRLGRVGRGATVGPLAALAYQEGKANATSSLLVP
jgi:hypothetical protein